MRHLIACLQDFANAALTTKHHEQKETDMSRGFPGTYDLEQPSQSELQHRFRWPVLEKFHGVSELIDLKLSDRIFTGLTKGCTCETH